MPPPGVAQAACAAARRPRPGRRATVQQTTSPSRCVGSWRAWRSMAHQYWRNYDFYGLLHGCGAAAPATVHGALSRDACLQRCSSRWDCQAVAHHQEQAVCRLYTQCDDGELGSQPCAEEWCGYMRASWLGTAALHHVKIVAGMAGQRAQAAECPRLAEARGWPDAERSLRGASWPKAEPSLSRHRRLSAPRAAARPCSSCAIGRELCPRCPSGPTRT